MTTTPSGAESPAAIDQPPRLHRTLRTADGLAVVVGIMIGSGIFRTPGLVAAPLGRADLTFVAWALGGALAWMGALVFAELSTRHPHAGGKYVYAREAFGRRAGFVVGWTEALGMYCAAIAAVAVVSGEYLARLLGLRGASPRVLGVVLIALVVALNLRGVAAGRRAQNLATSAKVLALGAVVVAAFVAGDGAGWHSPAAAPATGGLLGAMAVAFQAVIWTYYGYPDAAKIAEEMEDPGRTLPRVYLLGVGLVTGLYLLLNAAFLHVLPMDRIAGSTLVAGDVMQFLFGPRAGALMAGLALLVVLATLNGNVFVTPRVVFGLARDGLAPRALSRVAPGGTPSTAMLLVGAVAVVLAATGTFESLLSLAILLVLILDGFMVPVLFRLRARAAPAGFAVPWYPLLPSAFLGVYAVLLVFAVRAQPRLAAVTAAALAATYLVGVVVDRRHVPRT